MRFEHAAKPELWNEFKPLLNDMASCIERLASMHETWPFEEGEQSVVGTFMHGAARQNIISYVESTFHHKHRKGHRERIDLWLAMPNGGDTFIEFKLQKHGKDNCNLRKALECAERQLRRVEFGANERALAVVIFHHTAQWQHGRIIDRFRHRADDLIVSFQGPKGQVAMMFFKQVWPCSMNS